MQRVVPFFEKVCLKKKNSGSVANRFVEPTEIFRVATITRLADNQPVAAPQFSGTSVRSRKRLGVDAQLLEFDEKFGVVAPHENPPLSNARKRASFKGVKPFDAP